MLKDRDQVVESACKPVLESLESRRHLDGNTVQSLPFVLDFSSDRGEILDREGQGTGLTRLQVNENNNQYQASLIDLDTTAGLLKFTTTGTSVAGSNAGNDNTLVNALETQFDGTVAGGWQVTARLKGPLSYMTAPYQQGGIYVGPDQDNFVKLVAIRTSSGSVLQFKDELNGSTTSLLPSSVQNVNIGSFSSITTLDVRLVGDNATGKISAYYSVNGASFVKLAADLTLTGADKTRFFNATSRTGLMQCQKNDLAPITVSYDSFEIRAVPPIAGRPTVTAVRPANGDTGVSRDSFIAADVNLPNVGYAVDPASLLNNVRLYRTSDHQYVNGIVNGSGGGDAIVFTPSTLLDANTNYTFEITDQVKDLSGAQFVPFTSTFTTGTSGGSVNTSIAFEQVALSVAQGQSYTCVTIGPDRKLYASTIDGLIQRFTINADGTLSSPQNISTIQTNNGGSRFITGIAFDPASTSGNLILWVSNGQFAATGANDWTGKITKLTGSNLQTYQDVITGLPRSIKDHLNNQIVFGPDGKMYFSVASNTAMGAPDSTWGMRPERLLTASILQVDLTKLPATLPLNVQTESIANPYNPFATNAPVKLYAVGNRNTYDLLWHTNGHLYGPTNGSASGGATPASPNPAYSNTRIDQSIFGDYTGPVVPGISRVNETEHDWLFDFQQLGYYGHPNPARYEWVMNGGNPTSGTDPYQVSQYPVGTQPDRNYRGPAFDFGTNYSPNGIVEYRSGAFGGQLTGKMLIARYSGGDDIIVLTPNASGQIVQAETGITGLTGFVDPLDLTEDRTNGYIYVAEYGGQKLTLLRPIAPGAHASLGRSNFYFNDIQTSSSGGSGGSPAQTLTITNTGTAPLLLPSDAFTISGTNASQFSVSGVTVPMTVAPGQSVNANLVFTANSTGIKTATLTVKSNDPNFPLQQVSLRGIGTTGVGGSNEPSLQRILDLYQIPVTVGDSNPSDTTFPVPPATPNDEVVMPRLQRAGAGEVTIEVLAAMANNDVTGPSFGYYSPGTPGFKTPLFGINQSQVQSVYVNPVGQTQFDPGTTTFSLYSLYPKFSNREVYSEDVLNTWESNSANRRKMRFYPLKNTDGSVVPNAFVFGTEEYNLAYDFNDIVGIIRNVRAAPAGPELGLENRDSSPGLPFPDRLVFNRIQNPDTTNPNLVHDKATLRVRNTGSSTLTLSSFSFSGPFAIDNGVTGPVNIASGASQDIVIKFTGANQDIFNGSLTVNSNDADESAKVIQLVGWWQSHSENNSSGVSQEPTLAEVIQVMGYGTAITFSGQSIDTGGVPTRVGEETLSAYWRRADTNIPVTVQMLAAFHQQAATSTSTIRWHYQGASATVTKIFKHNTSQGQSFLPYIESSTTNYALGTFTPTSTTPFGFKVDSHFSDDTLNPPDAAHGHAFRFWQAKDRSGNIIPNAYLVAQDYTGFSFTNFDYQDNIYLISNIKPVNPPSAVTGATASGSTGGITLGWTKNKEGNVSGYRIYRSATSGGTYSLLNSTLLTTNSYVDLAAPVGVSYYRITAVDYHGGESTPANVSATRPPAGNAPNAPSGLIASATGPTQVNLTWADNSGNETGFRVERKTGSSGTYSTLTTTAANIGNFSDTTALEGTTYFYRVFAISGAIDSTPSNEAQATTPATLPSAPSSLVATAQSATRIDLSWQDNSGNETSFRVERGTDGVTFSTVATTNLNTTRLSDTGLSPQTTYFYRVFAVNSAGDSSASNVAQATTPEQGAVPSAPGGLTATAFSSNRVDLTWLDNSSDETGFRIERKTGAGAYATVGNALPNATSFTDNTVSANTSYTYRVIAVNANGDSPASNEAVVTTPPSSTSFSGTDIGAPAAAGSITTITPGSDYNVTGAGADVWANADQFFFANMQVTGDFDLRARIDGVSYSTNNPLVGLMARESLAANSKNAFIRTYGSSGNNYRWGTRTSTGGTTNAGTGGTYTYPNTWVRLTRVGNVFTGYSSSNGTTWTVVGSTTINMANTIYIGMAVCSHVTTATTATARFRSVSLIQ